MPIAPAPPLPPGDTLGDLPAAFRLDCAPDATLRIGGARQKLRNIVRERRFVEIAACAFALHIGGLCLIDWLEQPSDAAHGQETAVEVLTSEQADREMKGEKGATPSSEAQQESAKSDAPAASGQSRPRVQSQLKAAASGKELSAATFEPERSAAQSSSLLAPPQAAAPDTPQPKSAPKGVIVERGAVANLPQAAGKRGSPTQDSPKERPAAGQSEAARENEARDTAQAPKHESASQKPEAPEAEPNPFGALAEIAPPPKPNRTPAFLSPDSFKAANKPGAAPDPTNDNFRALVLGKVAETMLNPEKPRPKAMAVVAFKVGDHGEIIGLSLARPSGFPDLDAEALDMVRRAAPFPPPPPNATRDFGASIVFGGD